MRGTEEGTLIRSFKQNGQAEKFLVAVLKAPFEWKPGKIYGEGNIKYRDM